MFLRKTSMLDQDTRPDLLSDVCWREAIDLFLVDRSDLTEATKTRYRRTLTMLSFQSSVSPKNLNRIHISRFLSDYSGNTTYNFHLFAIKSFCDWFSDCFNTYNIAAKIRPAKEVRVKDVRVICDAEYQAIFKMSGKIRDIVVFLCNTGLRVSERCSITLDNVNLDRQIMTIVGKGNKERVVPLNATAMQILTKYNFNISKSRWTVGNNLKYLAKKLGIPKFSPHACRRYFTTRVLDKGANLPTVSKILGHSNVNTTTKYYYNAKELSAVTDLLDGR